MYSTNALCIAIVLRTRDSLWQPVCAVTLFVICYVYTATTQPHIRAEKLRTKFDSTMYHQWTKNVFTFGDLPLKETFLYGLKAKYRQGYIKPLLLSIFLEWPKHLHILDCPKYFRGNKILFISIFVYGNYFNFHTHKRAVIPIGVLSGLPCYYCGKYVNRIISGIPSRSNKVFTICKKESERKPKDELQT